MAKPDTTLEGCGMRNLTALLGVLSCMVASPLGALAQKAAGQVVAGEVKSLPTHENSAIVDFIFGVINYGTGIACAGCLIFGLIWLLQRRNATEDEVEETAEVETSTAAEAKTDAAPETTPASESTLASEPVSVAETEITEKASADSQAEVEK